MPHRIPGGRKSGYIKTKKNKNKNTNNNRNNSRRRYSTVSFTFAARVAERSCRDCGRHWCRLDLRARTVRPVANGGAVGPPRWSTGRRCGGGAANCLPPGQIPSATVAGRLLAPNHRAVDASPRPPPPRRGHRARCERADAHVTDGRPLVGRAGGPCGQLRWIVTAARWTVTAGRCIVAAARWIVAAARWVVTASRF